MPETARLTTPRLPSGTQRILERAGITDDLVALRAMTIGQLMKIPGFGKACLIDLIEAALRTRRFAGMIEPAGHASLPVGRFPG